MNLNYEKTADDSTRFTVSNSSGLDVSIINSIRRVIINNIPNVGFNNEVSSDINIVDNNTVIHNEYLEHRISMIPICLDPEKIKPMDYLFVIRVKNDTDNDMLITSDNLEIYKKTTDRVFTVYDLELETFKQDYKDGPLSNTEKYKIIKPFKYKKKNHFITLTKLKNENLTGTEREHLTIFASPSINTGKQHSTYNHVSQCSYNYTVDDKKAKIERDALPTTEHKSFDNLDRQKFYIMDEFDRPCSYDFVINSFGFYNNKNTLKKACDILIEKFTNFKENVLSNNIAIENSKDIKNGIEINVPHEDDTLGNPLQKIIINNFLEFAEEPTVKFCSYVKPHPLFDNIVIKMVCTGVAPQEIFSSAADMCIGIIEDIKVSL